MPRAEGRVGWRISAPAVNYYWGQLAHRSVLPPDHLPTILVRATKVDPPFVTPELRAALAEHLGDRLTALVWDCDHMIVQARPAETPALIRSVL